MKKSLNIAFFGSSDFVLPILNSVKGNQGNNLSEIASEQIKGLKKGYKPNLTKDIEGQIKNIDVAINLTAVITQPDRQNRKKIIPNPVSLYCQKNKISLYQPENINENLNSFENAVGSLDIAITASYGQLISNEIINKAKYGFVNWHPSLLPKYRGATPMQTAIANGDSITGLSWIDVAKKMDAGEIYLQIEQQLDNSTDIEKLAKDMGELGEKTWAIAISLKILSSNNSEHYKAIIQDENKTVLCKMLSKEDAFLDYKAVSAEELYNHYKAYKFFPKTKIICPRFGEIKLIEAKEVLSEEQVQTLKQESEILFDKNDGSNWIQLKKGKEIISLLGCAKNYLQIGKIGLQDGKQIDLRGYEFK